jgi:VWFA-related protein
MTAWLTRAVAAGLVVAFAAPSAFAQADERTVYASVVDKDGTPLLDLTAKDFIVREDGMAREVLRVAKDDDPLQVALLVDNSTVMRDRLTQLRKAAAAFVRATRAGAPLALITLAERPTIVVGYTTDHAQLLKSIENMFASRPATTCSTALPKHRRRWPSARCGGRRSP